MLSSKFKNINQVCVHMFMCVYAHVCGSQRLALGIFLNHSPWCLRQNLLLNLKLTGLARPAVHQASGILIVPPPQVGGYRCAPPCPGFLYMGDNNQTQHCILSHCLRSLSKFLSQWIFHLVSNFEHTQLQKSPPCTMVCTLSG